MPLITRIDALPIRAKVLCGSFAYGYTEKGDEPWDAVASTAFRVGADVYRYTRPYSPPAHRAGRGEAEAVGGAQPRRAGGRMSEIKEIKK